MEDQTIIAGTPTNLTRNAFTKEGYNFIKWNTAPDGSGINYEDGQLVTNIENTNLYAQWSNTKYHYNGEFVFDGTNYINTNLKLFSAENKDKDFIVKFTINEIGSNQVAQAIIFGAMDETRSSISWNSCKI